MDRFDPFVKYADVYGDIINWEKDPMNKPQNQNKYFFSDGKTYYEQICKMLRLMSVFKEAFNQIYSNEDEISEAWENFVNNLSASVVEGSEPDVTLTWTDDSVNFEFTMVPGVPGEQGVGITSISFNSDYTMTITLSDGNTYTSMSLKGETGPQGPQGETGSGLQILDVYATLADLQSAHPTGQPGDAYQVGSEGSYTLYIWSSSQSAWIPAGSLGTVSPSTSNPLMDGIASAGSSNLYSRGDHVHPSDTSRASQEELDALIKTSQSLIDQSFTYRESPAIQDGLARIDKIKGNTLVWNQLVQNGNFADSSNWSGQFTTVSISNGVANVTLSAKGDYVALRRSNLKSVTGHKYFVTATVKCTKKTAVGFYLSGQYAYATGYDVQADTLTKVSTFINGGTDQGFNIYVSRKNELEIGDVVQVSNVMLIDLTQMGLDITDPSDFTSLFPLSYYSYNQGSLLSFNGNGIKTDNDIYNKYATDPNRGYVSDSFLNGTQISSSQYDNISEYVNVIPNIDYVLSGVYGNSASICFYNSSKQATRAIRYQGNTTIAFVPSNDEIYVRFSIHKGYEDIVHLSKGAYTSSTLSLPISTYFPNGMKSAGNVYDELTPRKAITRIGAIDLGTLDWTKSTNYNTVRFITADNAIPLAKLPSNNTETANIKSRYNAFPTNDLINNSKDGIALSSVGGISVRDSAYASGTAEAFKTAMSGVYLYYELATPTETDADLDLSFNAYENGTEQLLPVNGSVPATSPVIADMAYLSIDDAMEYIIEKLANVPQNTQQILESLEDDVADLQTDVGALQPAVSALQTSVGNINTNIGQLSSTVAGHTSSISDMQSDISDLNTGLSDLEDTVTDHTSRIGTLESGLSATNGNVQSLSSQVQSIGGRVTNLETDLLIVVKKEYDYDSVAGNGNFGVQTGLQQEPGYKIIGIVGSEVQQGENTSGDPWIIVTQAHVHYTSTGGVVLSMKARNVSEYTKTNVRVYLYLLCIKDTQSE